MLRSPATVTRHGCDDKMSKKKLNLKIHTCPECKQNCNYRIELDEHSLECVACSECGSYHNPDFFRGYNVGYKQAQKQIHEE